MDPVHHDRCHPSGNVALFRQKQVDGGIHDIESDDLFDQVLLKHQIGKANAEQDHGNGFADIQKQILAHAQKPPFRNSV